MVNGEAFGNIIYMYEEKLANDAVMDEYFTDPALWATDRLGATLYWKQQEVCDALGRSHNVAVKAGHGVGKSFLAALLTCWWIDTRPINKLFVATTAPSAAQVTGVIWREIHRMHQLSQKMYREYLDAVRLGKDTTGMIDHPLPGRITQANVWKDNQGNIIAQGRKPPDNKADDAFQGFHDGYVLAIGDEACGLTHSMIDGLMNITTNENSKVLLIGNPTNPASFFASIFKENLGIFSLHTISVLDSPNFHGGGVCECHKGQPLGLNMPAEILVDGLVDQSFVDSKKKEYGETSARYLSRVLGEFAYDAGNTLFSELDIAQGKNAVVFPDEDEPYLVLGVDIARMGQDSTYVYSYEHGLVQATDPIDISEDGKPASLGDQIIEDTHGKVYGGKLRHVDHWKQRPFVTLTNADEHVTKGTSEMVHELAISLNAREVRVDASGNGSGILDPLAVLCYNAGNPYIIVEMYGSGASPDRRAFHNNRAWRYAEMRREMFQGLIDVDPEDETLLDELAGIQYEFSTSSGGLLIESKDSMKKRGVHSPDAADAAWYACADLSDLGDRQPGDIVTEDSNEFLEDPWYTSTYAW